jgi:hypothetical protein
MPSIKETMPVLLSGTPLSNDLLKDGWPFFSFAEKVEILNANPTVGRYYHGFQVLQDLALNDENPLIRRWAAQNISKPRNDKDTVAENARDEELWARVQLDPNARVREPWADNTWANWLPRKEDPERFWAQDRYHRLLAVNGSNDAKWMAGVIKYAIDHGLLDPDNGSVSVPELHDIILQFLNWHKGKWVDPTRWDKIDLSPLWMVATDPGLPPRIRGILMYELPGTGFSATVSTESNKPWTEEELVKLLERKDFDPYQFRLTTFNSGSPRLKKAALSVPGFQLTDDEFFSFFPVPQDAPEVRKEKLEQIHFLGEFYRGASLPQLVALNVISNWFYKEWHALHDDGSYLFAGSIGDRVATRVAILATPYKLREEASAARWMLLVDRAAHPKPEYRQELPERIPKWIREQLQPAIVPGDLWTTFNGLRRVRPGRNRWLVRLLPPLDSTFDFEDLPVQFRGRDLEEDEPLDLTKEAEVQLKVLPKEPRVFLDLASYAINELREELAEIKEAALQPAQLIQQGSSLVSRIVESSLVSRIVYGCLVVGVTILIMRSCGKY